MGDTLQTEKNIQIEGVVVEKVITCKRKPKESWVTIPRQNILDNKDYSKRQRKALHDKRVHLVRWHNICKCLYPQHVCAWSVFKSCMTLCYPMDYSLPASSVIRIIQARIMEWATIASSRRSSWLRDWTHDSGIPALASRCFITEPPRKPCEPNMLLLLLSCFSHVRLCVSP